MNMDVRCEAEAKRDGILRQLKRLLNDRRFTTSGRSARFLRYVVERALAGSAADIEESCIATQIYGWPGDDGSRLDSRVRFEGSCLRAKLKSYYEEEGWFDPIRITIPEEGYVPSFELREKPGIQRRESARRPALGMALRAWGAAEPTRVRRTVTRVSW